MSTRFDRRQALAALGTVSLGGLLAACGGEDEPAGTKTATPSGGVDFDGSASCAVTPELTEGPYYFDVDAIRSDITEGREGTPLRLALRVRDADTCEPIENAVVDIWHCDALGVYSGFESATEETFLRGAQVTNREGVVEFTTIYPGWYRGRTVHIHLKVHLDKHTVLTSQLFTNEAFDEQVYADAPYAGRDGRDVDNAGDGIYDERLEMTLSREGDAVRGVMTLDVQRGL
jgi:protocatechuate 3,4-dioxygenase beta subunit